MLMFSHVGIYFLPVFTSLQIDWVIFDCLIYLQVYWWERIKKTRNEGQRSEGLWTFHTAQTTYNSPSLTQDPASLIRSQTVPGQLSLFHLCLHCMAALFSICGRLTSLIKSGFWRAVVLTSSWHPMPLINLLGNLLLKECKKTFHRLAVRQVWCCTGPLLKPVLSTSISCPKTRHQRSWTLALSEHFDHGNSSAKAKTNKRCTSNHKTFFWWNSLFRLLLLCILVAVQPNIKCIFEETLE